MLQNVRTTIHPVLRNMTTPKMFSIHDVKTPVNKERKVLKKSTSKHNHLTKSHDAHIITRSLSVLCVTCI